MPTQGQVQQVKPGAKARAFGRLHVAQDLNSPAIPAATICALGKGRIAATWFTFSRGYMADHAAARREFLHGLVRELFPQPIAEVRGSKDVDVVVNRAGRRLAINLVNTSGPHRTEPMLESIDPIGPLEVTIRVTRKPSQVTLEPGGQTLAFNYDSRQIHLTLPRLDIHNIVLVK